MAAACVEPLPLYRPRDPQDSDLWRLLDQHFETFQSVSGERTGRLRGQEHPLRELAKGGRFPWSGLVFGRPRGSRRCGGRGAELNRVSRYGLPILARANPWPPRRDCRTIQAAAWPGREARRPRCRSGCRRWEHAGWDRHGNRPQFRYWSRPQSVVHCLLPGFSSVSWSPSKDELAQDGLLPRFLPSDSTWAAAHDRDDHVRGQGCW